MPRHRSRDHLPGLTQAWKSYFSIRTKRFRRKFSPFFAALKATRFKFVGYAFILFFVTLEIVLQIASFVTWRSAIHQPSKKILCVGEYYAPEAPIYPTALKRELKKSGKNQYDVVDLQQKAMTSKQAAHEIDKNLEDAQTTAVYLMVGMSELRSRPVENPLASRVNEHVLDSKSASFQWKFRSPGLLHRIWDSFSYQSFVDSVQPAFPAKTFQSVPAQVTTSAAKDPKAKRPCLFIDFPMKNFPEPNSPDGANTFPAGRWTLDGKVVDFQKNAVFSQSNPAKWWTRRNQLSIQTDKTTYSYFWQVRNDQLLLMYDFLPVVTVLKKDPNAKAAGNLAPPEDLILGWQAMGQQNFAAAKAYFLKQTQAFPADPMGHAGRAVAEFRAGNPAEAQKELATVRNLHQNAPDRRSAESLLYAMGIESSSDKVDLTKELISQYPESPFLWFALSEEAYREDCHEVADEAMQRAIALVPDTLRMTKALFLRFQSKMLVERNPKAALQSSILAYLHDDQSLLFRADVIRNLEQYSTVSIDECFPKDSILENKKRFLKSVFRVVTAEKSVAMIQAFEQNLIYIIQHCKVHKVPVVLILYPKRGNEANPILVRVAKETSTDVIDLRSVSLESFRKVFSGDRVRSDPSWMDPIVTNSVLQDARKRF